MGESEWKAWCAVNVHAGFGGEGAETCALQGVNTRRALTQQRVTDQAAKGDGTSGSVSTRPRRQRSWEVGVQRARALRGDALEELTEGQREWVWRSLLRGVRLAQATKLAQLAPDETPQALQQVAKRYSVLMNQRRRERQAQRATQIRATQIRATHIMEEEAGQ